MDQETELHIRKLVREIVRETEKQTPSIDADDRIVRLDSDKDLREFVLEILEFAHDPNLVSRFRSGELRFCLAGRTASSQAPARVQLPERGRSHDAELEDEVMSSDGRKTAVRRIEKGVVTEKLISKAAESGSRLILGRRVVITPLAREKARQCGVQVERV